VTLVGLEKITLPGQEKPLGKTFALCADRCRISRYTLSLCEINENFLTKLTVVPQRKLETQVRKFTLKIEKQVTASRLTNLDIQSY